VANQLRVKDLSRAEEIKQKEIPGELSVGWNFPKENEIRQMWDEWDKMYSEQIDLEKFFVDHFEDLKKRHAEQEEKERLELSS